MMTIFDYNYQNSFRLCFVRVDFHCRLIFTCVNEIEAIYERPRVYVKVERG